MTATYRITDECPGYPTTVDVSGAGEWLKFQGREYPHIWLTADEAAQLLASFKTGRDHLLRMPEGRMHVWSLEWASPHGSTVLLRVNQL